MYTPYNLLPDYVSINQRRLRFRDRWKPNTGKQLSNRVLNAISAGKPAVLQSALAAGPPDFFEGSFDLRGLRFVDFSLSRPDNELFRNAVLNYSRFRDAHISRTAIVSISGNFVDAARTRFEDTTFVRTNFFGANFEDCTFSNCNFLDRNNFANCSFKNVIFEDCFFETDIFTDCLFDESTRIINTQQVSHHFNYWKQSVKKFDRHYSSGFYSGIREAYEAGHVSTLARRYLFKEKQAFTRYNTPDRSEKLTRYFVEYTNGYGIKPLRVIMSALIIFSMFCLVFLARFGMHGFLLSAGGFFTFGADTGLLDSAGFGYHILYVVEAFFGITNMSIFIVVMTNYWSALR